MTLWARLPDLTAEELAELHDAIEARIGAVDEILAVSTAPANIVELNRIRSICLKLHDTVATALAYVQ